MKLLLIFTLGIVAGSLPTTILAQTIVSTTPPTLSGTTTPVTSAGSVISSGSYIFATDSDLILGQEPVSETHGTLAENTFNGGWTGSSTNNTPTGNAAALANLTDGSFGGDVPSQGGFAAAGDSSTGNSAIYSLGTNSMGYNLTDLEVYSGWQDAGRYDQAYTIEYSLVSAPGTFLTLATVNDYPSSAAGGVGAMTELTPTSGPYLATNVADVEFVFNAGINGWSGYRELVVNGVASVPEPSTWALILLGLVGLAFGFRRRAARSA